MELLEEDTPPPPVSLAMVTVLFKTVADPPYS
jgi:hypothetical protein